MVSKYPAMRYATITMRPTSGYFDPIDRRLADAPDITREAIHHFELLDDGTLTLLASVRGNMERYRDILTTSPEVIEFAVAGIHEGFGYGYSQIEPNALNRHLIEQQRSSEYIVQTPVEYTSDGGQRITMIGTAESFARADPPQGVDVEIDEIGEYHPTMNQLFAQLTVRQREVLERAIEKGYYKNPRQTTHEEIAEHLDITPGSVGQHLRNIEATVFGQYPL